jgi:transposase-like protein
MDAAKTEVLAFTAFPKAHWIKIWSNNPVRHEALCDRAEMEGLRLRVVAAA